MKTQNFSKITFLFLLIGFININLVKAQENKVYVKADKGPYYLGGTPALKKFFKNNLKYPAEALAAKKTGVVEVSFIIENTGVITNIEVTQEIGYGCDEEAARVVRKMPKWAPGTVNGKAVRVLHKISINFPFE